MRGLGELEAAVMDRLWSRAAPATVREVCTDLQADRRIAYTTVMTVMDNLFKKGVLRRELDGRAYRYTPILDQAEYSADLMRQALDASGDQTAAFLRFLERITPEEAEALAEAYRRITGRRPR
jgi:predicted transcriptional regulator